MQTILYLAMLCNITSCFGSLCYIYQYFIELRPIPPSVAPVTVSEVIVKENVDISILEILYMCDFIIPVINFLNVDAKFPVVLV